MSKNDKPKKRRKSNIPENESKHEKFKRVCTPRLRKALKAIKQVGACSSKDYAYNNEQREKIGKALSDAVGVVIKQYSGTAAEETAIEL